MRLGAVLIEGNDGFKRWLQKSFLLRPEFINFPRKRVFSHDNASMLAFEPVEKPGQATPSLTITFSIFAISVRFLTDFNLQGMLISSINPDAVDNALNNSSDVTWD